MIAELTAPGQVLPRSVKGARNLKNAVMTVTLQTHAAGLTWVQTGAMGRAAHALSAEGQVWLVDPFEDDAAAAAVTQLGTPAGVVQLLDRHNRDCEQVARRLAVPLVRLPERLPGTPFEVVPVLSRWRWHEVALWWPERKTLVVAEAIGTAPVFTLGRAAGVHPMLRLTPPRGALGRYRPQRLLVGHGRALASGGAAALADALSRSRTDLPRLLTQVPGLLTGG